MVGTQLHKLSRADVTNYADSFTALATAQAASDCRLLTLERLEFLRVVDEPSALATLERLAHRCSLGCSLAAHAAVQGPWICSIVAICQCWNKAEF